MTSLELLPTKREIEEQLRRMLSAKRFLIAENQSAFLALAVNRALEDKKTPGHVVAKELFSGKFRKNESTDVRVTAGNLRRTLTRYYAEEGGDDPVLIALPAPPADKKVKLSEGEAYTPHFSYNPNHSIARDFMLGEYYSARGMYDDYDRAFKLFSKIRKAAPDHIGAAIGITECLCGFLYWETGRNTPAEKEESIYLAATSLDRASERAGDFWRLHAAGGFMLTENGDLIHAKSHFIKALALDRTSTETYAPYLHFLVRSGSIKESLRLAKRNVDLHPGNIAAHVTRGKILIEANDIPEAIVSFEAALDMDKGYYAIHQYLLFLRLAQFRLDDALRHVEMLGLLADNITSDFSGKWAEKIIDHWPEQKKQEWKNRLNEVNAEAALNWKKRFLS
jgi:tetratricopeptide (TPR) repeat protein